MKATVDAVQSVRRGEELLLTVTVHAPQKRTHVYRVSLRDYEEAGSPATGDELSLDELSSLVGEEDARLAYARAVKILAAGDNTKKNLVRKLTERGFLRESAESAVARLAEEGYIREEELLLRQLSLYAKRLWGPKRFLPNLIEKGFSRGEIEAALAKARDAGVYDAEAIKAEVLRDLPEEATAERRARLYKHGF